jgi:diaminopimelate decarboxylase
MGQSLLEIPAPILDRVADAVDTPVYVYCADTIRARYRELSAALSDVSHRILYSVKANSNLSVLQLLRSLGAGVDIVSAGELTRVLRAGFPAEEVVFSGVGKTKRELTEAVSQRIGLINVESEDELTLLAEIARGLDTPVRFGFRVNPDVATNTHPYTQTGERGMKFGVPMNEVTRLARWASDTGSLSLISVGMHIGSQILDSGHYEQGATKLSALVAELREAGFDELVSLDVGGGIGIRYTDELPLDPQAYAKVIRRLADQTGLDIMLEPGRFLVGNAGLLLTRCVHRKQSGGRHFVVVDAGMNDLLRPSLYGAVHDICRVTAVSSAATESTVVDVVGPICETGDFLGFERELPGVVRGTLLAVRGAGAYGFTMSSTYNSRPRPPEVLVDGDRWAVIRERETVEDLMRGEPAANETQLDWQTVSYS